MRAAVICREFKWTWEEYENQPAAFVDTIMAMMEAEATVEKRKQQTGAAKSSRQAR